MLAMTMNSLEGLPGFLAYFGSAVILMVLFGWVYIQVTPYREITLIRDGNVAAAIAFSGAVLGYAMPVASVIAHSVSLLDMVVWSVVALLVQIAVYVAARIIMPGIVSDIPNNRPAPAVLLAVMSIIAGLLNAACMTY